MERKFCSLNDIVCSLKLFASILYIAAGAIESFISESPMTTIYNGYFDPNISIMFSVAFGVKPRSLSIK